MTAEPSTDSTAPNLNLSAEEKRAYGQLFRQADTGNVGVVTGEVAVNFFDKTRLDQRILGEIWQIADRENRGFLTPAGFGVVLRLIGHAQAGREPTAELALQQGPLPRFDGFVTSQPASPPPTMAPLQSQGTGGGPIRIPPLTPEKVVQYTGLFERQPLQAGTMLPGEQAKQIFEKSGLPNEALGKIWHLADTEQRGALVLTEFVIAMHLLTSMKTGALRGLPTILPAALYDAATRRPTAARQSPASTGPIPAIPRQLSGNAQMRTGSPLGRPPLVPQGTGATSDWLVTPADKIKFDKFFDDLDTTHKGFVTGEEAVQFLSLSQLPEDALAQIWDLADINSDGRLNRDTFAVAMYLIRQQRMRKDGSNSLPSSLVPSLIPPAMRSQVRPPTANSAFDIPPPRAAPPPKSALDDLFGLETSSTPPPAPAQTALSTGGSNTDPFATSSAKLQPNSPAKPSPTGTTFRPFVPSSSFGRGLSAQATGDSSGSGPGLVKSPPSAVMPDDLLGDADPEISKKLTNETAELGNLSNQIGILSKQMQEVQGQRTATQNQLNQANASKKTFEQRLSQLRALYEKEAQDVQSLEEQLSAARKDIQKLQGDCLQLEGTYRDIQEQHRQGLLSLQADQQENSNLKEKIRAVNAEIAQLKPQIEKMKSEARQQKGLVAINKKQLVTSEAERDKLTVELEEGVKSNEELSRQVNSDSPASTAGQQIASPTPSTASGNNPFFRRTGSTDIMGTFASPSIKSFTDKSFDDVFGPSFPPVASMGTPPPTSFKQHDTGTSTASIGSPTLPGTSTPNISHQASLSAEATAPPESRQISSSLLPFTDPSESLSSSRQVSPPLSRIGDKESLPGESLAGLSPFPTEANTIDTGVEAAVFKGPSSPLTEDKPVSNGSATAPLSMSGAGDATRPAAEADPFAAMDQKAKAKADFDNAFASLKPTQDQKLPDPSSASSAFNSEFPPIAELERDEESDSASERGGFDDDFAPTSPKPKTPTKGDGRKEPLSPTKSKPPGTQAVENSRPSTAAETEQSDRSQSPVPGNSALGIADLGKPTVDDIFGVAAPPEPATAPGTTPTVSSKVPFDDLDDDFEGLEDAKEGSADDDFANISRSGLDDYNPVFDSSPPASQAKSESTAFGVESSFDFVSVSANSAIGASNLGPGSSVSGNAQGKTPAVPGAHDWDAIFADLDSPGESAALTPPASAPSDTRPKPTGRALTEDGEHDDPILKNLTSMGYSRADAVLALEKYDYNLERAANYLASQS